MPAYNEAENIAVMIARVRDIVGPQVDDLEVVVVNDGSADDTGAIGGHGRQGPPRPAGGAPRQPRLRCRRPRPVWATTKELVFFTDSDLQFDLKELAPFLARQADADLIIGYRYARSDPWYRSLFGHGWSWLVNVMFGHVRGTWIAPSSWSTAG
jgi:glycosyltransferase involved in cell wall biosynthesis